MTEASVGGAATLRLAITDRGVGGQALERLRESTYDLVDVVPSVASGNAPHHRAARRYPLQRSTLRSYATACRAQRAGSLPSLDVSRRRDRVHRRPPRREDAPGRHCPDRRGPGQPHRHGRRRERRGPCHVPLPRFAGWAPRRRAAPLAAARWGSAWHCGCRCRGQRRGRPRGRSGRSCGGGRARCLSRHALRRATTPSILACAYAGDARSRPFTRLPAVQGDEGPDALHESERPRALEEAVDRRKGARSGKAQDEPVAAILERVAGHHGGHGEQAEGG
jgi:hypothetical protein